ncbi:ATP-grasp fold amidoligase family protein [Phytohalomonas tamaricis]|uniref:ATP-grasp fold amidoligase family protein n=1 Tax=Phytohalomonas tamaricis TaxID=2081032 RepID=UPI000D0AC68B|nr:ATP-grasp fold amidoligase family protein [Phytohalomonas tamaricis]
MSLLFSFQRLRCLCSETFRRIKRSDRQEAIRQYQKRFGHPPSLENPTSWSEKLTRFKLEADRPLYRQLADKLAVRDFVAAQIGEEYLIPLIDSAPRLSRKMFDALPEAFVIKANHGSAMNHIVFNKAQVSFAQLRQETDRWISRNFYCGSRETQYRQIPRRVLVERLMTDRNGTVPVDYKFHCFRKNGKPYIIVQVDSDRFDDHCRDYFTADWQRLPLKVKYPNSPEGRHPVRPEQLDALLQAATTLANGFAYVRVDLYVVQGRVYFGEMTFTPGSGFERFEPPTFDRAWGDLFDLEHQLSLFTLKDLEAARISNTEMVVTNVA